MSEEKTPVIQVALFIVIGAAFIAAGAWILSVILSAMGISLPKPAAVLISGLLMFGFFYSSDRGASTIRNPSFPLKCGLVSLGITAVMMFYWFTVPSYAEPFGPYISTPTPPITRGATAICKDGTSSYSASRSGTCSHHGGVSQWLR